MERKQFIQKSLLAAAGFGLLPSTVKAFKFNEYPSPLMLRVNNHIRHGYYGKEFVSNELNIGQSFNLRIDRFENPEGDMVLYDFYFDSIQLRISINNDQLIVHHNNDFFDIDLTKINNNMLWNHSDKLALVRNNAKNITWYNYKTAIKLNSGKSGSNYFYKIDDLNKDEFDDQIYFLIN